MRINMSKRNCTRCFSIGEAIISTNFIIGCKPICERARKVTQGIQTYLKKFDKTGTNVSGRVVR